MSDPSRAWPRTALAAVIGAGVVASPLLATPALADTAGTGVVINEAYLKGGSSNAPFKQKFVELYNPATTAVDLDGWSLQYRSSGGTGKANGIGKLEGTIPAGGYFLIAMNGNGTVGEALPTPDLDIAGSINAKGTDGTLFLAKTDAALTLPTGSVTGNADVVDLLGYGTSNTFEGHVATVDGGNSDPTSLVRDDFKDRDDNAADLTSQDIVTPHNAQGDEASSEDGTDPGTEQPGETPGTGEGTDPEPETVTPIAEIQGTGTASPLVNKTVTTEGVVTATYPTGGFNGFYIQTPGTGGTAEADHTASDAVFVYSGAEAAKVKAGDKVQVTGKVSEYNGLTELTPSEVTQADATAADKVTPAKIEYPDTDAAREAYEGMLVQPQGDFTVTDNYDTNYYGEIGLAAGKTPLYNPTVKGAPGSDAYKAVVAHNEAAAVKLDDGASTNFNNSANKDQPIPYLSTKNPVRVGATVTFTKSVVLDYRNDDWKFQPTQQLTPSNATYVQPATFANTRTTAPENVGGDVRLAGFNVLNYFTDLGADVPGCDAYTDRDGKKITVSGGCDARGAWDQTSFQRQQSKIVAAINALDANVVSLEEIENSAHFGHDRDASLEALVAALNKADSLTGGEWAYVPSPEKTPENEDVIRTAFIYKKDSIEPTDQSVILEDAAFKNARQPLAQHFTAKSTDLDFVVIANHFKSKGGSGASGDNADDGNGAGAYNGDRTRQAQALVKFASTMEKDAGTENLFMIGDFNSYAAEDPIITIQNAGFVSQGAKTGKETYAYDGGIGSLDYVFASPAANKLVSGADVWNINSVEAVALEYSRYNYNVENFYADGPYRSSDHDPIVVGINAKAAQTGDTKELNLLNINDFHGRIDTNTVKFAGTIEQLKAENPDSTAFLSDGDNIGASLFESSVQQDQPTLDVLNALGLQASSVGNHEFDQGQDDLTGRVSEAADFDYLAANVTKDGKPILDSYKIVDVDGVKVGVIGAVTQETPTLVSPGGVTGLKFGDPVAAVNKVADQLSDGDDSNGEADVLVAEYHEGTSDGVSNNSTLEQALADGGAFKDIVEKTTAKVDVIFNGHTHAQYAWDAPVPGESGKTRPVLQTGSYGEFIGQVVLDYDTKTGETTTKVNHNVARTTDDDAALVSQFPAVAKVQTIVTDALAKADEVGKQVIGSASADITTAFKDGTRDDRASESTLGNLVADALVDKLSDTDRGGAEIGVVNPGGLRAELDAGDITYAEANAVLPFLNNLWTTTLTGAQFKTALEQQWQTTTDGTTPSRAYLQLGLSKNVTYTFDPDAKQGEHITSISVNGAPIDPKKEYRIGSFSFLLQGGDNFREFAAGTDTKDSGLVDRDAWIDYLKEHKPVSPDFARHAVAVKGLPTGEVKAGEKVTLDVSGLDLTSKGSPANTSLTAKAAAASTGTTPGGTGTSPVTASLVKAAVARAAADPLATVDVKDGAATIAFTVPDEPGQLLVSLVAEPTGTTVTMPLQVADDGSGSGGNGGSGSNGGFGSGGTGTGTGTGDGTNAGDSTDGGAGSGDNGGDTTVIDPAAEGSDLANTGADVTPWILGGGLAVVLGAVLTVLGMRRRKADGE